MWSINNNKKSIYFQYITIKVGSMQLEKLFYSQSNKNMQYLQMIIKWKHAPDIFEKH